jgi:putative ABC transport system substrate-binding protein
MARVSCFNCFGYAEGRNVAIEYRFADGRYDRLSAELTDLTQRKVGVIVFVGTPSLGRLTAAREAIGTPCCCHR